MRLRGLSVCVAAAVLLPALCGDAARAQAPDTPEPGSVEAIAAATTEPRFLSPWVSYVPDHPNVPSPTRHLGHIVGAPGELTNTTTLYAYYRALAAATRRVRVETIGKSEEGCEILLVIVGDEKSLDDLERNRQAVRAAPMALVGEPVQYTSEISGDGAVYLVRDTGQEALLAARVRLRHAPARRLPAIPGSILAKPWVPAQRSIDNETRSSTSGMTRPSTVTSSDLT